MMKDDRVIIHGVRMPDHLYLPGEEDALEEMLTPAEVNRLVANGTLEGNWVGKAQPRPILSVEEKLRQDLDYAKTLPPTKRAIYLESFLKDFKQKTQDTLRYMRPSLTSQRASQNKQREAAFNLQLLAEIEEEIEEVARLKKGGEDPEKSAFLEKLRTAYRYLWEQNQRRPSEELTAARMMISRSTLDRKRKRWSIPYPPE